MQLFRIFFMLCFPALLFQPLPAFPHLQQSDTRKEIFIPMLLAVDIEHLKTKKLVKFYDTIKQNQVKKGIEDVLIGTVITLTPQKVKETNI